MKWKAEKQMIVNEKESTRIEGKKMCFAKKRRNITSQAATQTMKQRNEIKINEAGEYEWERFVTESMARTNKTQKQYLPRPICRLALPVATSIMLDIQQNGDSLIKCPAEIVTAERDKFERCITKAWYDFQRSGNLQVGDKLVFKLANPPSTLMINIIKKECLS
ncbi:hypothetical protein TSUD_114510 [Trifolium subterraneum]|uniref:TF-B3 domain-containing protein n=1 Tax=Trifolium subterraneum TaxID=3900 RepID=A0A2Z6M7G8_TRISU|nr:hypothetical protein TSUD_114510 [Trifolium subterraneum]